MPANNRYADLIDAMTDTAKEKSAIRKRLMDVWQCKRSSVCRKLLPYRNGKTSRVVSAAERDAFCQEFAVDSNVFLMKDADFNAYLRGFKKARLADRP